MSKAISEVEVQTVSTEVQQTCGIIMPIAGMGEHYPESHWADVKVIISDAIKLAGFSPRLVSESDDARVIQSSIVQNVYNDPIIVCDVSAKNANVMFELGMRLAFDKPVVIVVDQTTGFSFDTAPIEHLLYRRDLRHSTVEEFKTKLAAKIRSTYEKSKDSTKGSFLSNFGQFKVAEINDREVSSTELLLQMSKDIAILKNQSSSEKNRTVPKTSHIKTYYAQPFARREYKFDNQENAITFSEIVELEFSQWVTNVRREEGIVVVSLNEFARSAEQYEKVSRMLNNVYSAITE